MDEEVRAAARSLIEDRPAFQDAFEELLEQEGTWEFDDVDIDSGTFGEIVSREIVERTDDGYRLKSRSALEAALKPSSEPAPSSVDTGSPTPSVSLPNVNGRRLGLLGAALLSVVLVRVLFSYSAVFRDGMVVLSGNDPYMYHHAADMLLAGPQQAFTLGGLSELSVDFLNAEIRTHDTLLIVGTWWTAAALGGDGTAVATVLAVYPVLAAVGSAVAIYLLTVRLTDDIRCGLASILVLAVIPAHAYRTSLGFGDHHALDFLWLSVTAGALVVVADNRGQSISGLDRSGTLAIVIGGLSIAAQTMSWRGGPLLFLPIAFYVVVGSFFDIDADRNPISEAIPLLTMLAIGAAMTGFVHVAFGWLPVYRAGAPALLLGGAAGVVAIAAGVQYAELPARTVFLAEGALGIGGLALVSVVAPSVISAIAAFGSYLQQYGGSGIAETYSLLSGELGSIIAPIFLFGLTLFVAVGYLGWVTWRHVYHEREHKWLAIIAFSWWLFVLALIQNRFAGELSLFVAVFAGIGFIHAAAWLDIIARPEFLSEAQDRQQVLNPLRSIDLRTVGYLAFLFLLIGGLAGVQSVVKINQISMDDADYETGVWTGAYADEHGLEYPENYVLSRWGSNRGDNYLVNGETESYEYALKHHDAFLASTSADGWYEQFQRDGVGFILVRPGQPAVEQMVYTRLREHYGSTTETSDALSHYRAIYAADGNIVFEVVSGATLRGTAASNTTVTASTTASLAPRQETISYQADANTSESGTYRLTVPYPGTYTIGNETVTVSESAVRQGETIQVE